jgi:hypothetical protein
MQTIQAFIEGKQHEFAAHPFFGQFHSEAPFDHVMGFAPKLAFWVMAFQDVLRLNESLVTDAFFRKIATHHRAEDSGHDVWFLHDMRQFGVPQQDVAQLFDAQQTAVRDATYALVAEVLQAKYDGVRIALLLALEGAGHVFFRRVSSYVEAQGHTHKLKYFSSHHLEVEQDHELFQDGSESDMEAVRLSGIAKQHAMTAVGRVFDAFTAMFTGLMDQPAMCRSAKLCPAATCHR